MQTLSPEQGMQLLETGGLLYPAILVALATGARRGECLALRWHSVDADKVSFVESLEQRVGMAVRAKAPKTDKFRNVAMPPGFADRLRHWKIEQAEALFALGVRQTSDTLVCQRVDGELLTPSMVTNAFPRLTQRVLGERHHFHGLRHAHATILLKAGVAAKVVQERLGTSSIRITLDVYAHVLAGMQEEAAAKLDDVFGSNPVANNL